MKLGITGSRHWTDEQAVWRRLEMLHSLEPITLLIHGGARGVDTFADRWARARGIKRRIIRPDYRAYGSNVAPIIRNRQIVAECDHLQAFRARGKSNGTDRTILMASDAGKLLPVIHEKVDPILVRDSTTPAE